MGDLWWSVLAGVALLAVPVVAVYVEHKKGWDKNGGPYLDEEFCPRCRHSTGLDVLREHCDATSEDGWGPTACQCTNDFHWRFVSRYRRPEYDF